MDVFKHIYSLDTNSTYIILIGSMLCTRNLYASPWTCASVLLINCLYFGDPLGTSPSRFYYCV